jgi:hypothetical protein
VESTCNESHSSRLTIPLAIARSSFSSSFEADFSSRIEYNYKPRCLRMEDRSVPLSPFSTARFCRKSLLRKFCFMIKPSSGSPNNSTSFCSTTLEIIQASSCLLTCTTVLDIFILLLCNVLILEYFSNRRASRTHNTANTDAKKISI